MKYYAVLEGRGQVPTILNTWEDCKKKVDKYPGAQYKSFKNLNDAKEYITPNKSKSNGNSLVAYVDGSYSTTKKNYSYGVVLLKKNKILKTMNGKGENEQAAKMRQVYGELQGVMKAVDFGIKTHEKEIHIYYDYYGIEYWATGKWNRNNQFTSHYHQFIQKRKDKLKIFFHKVPAHSGNKYNDMADRLAKEALK
ncbi:MAG: viroplasmin family protein [Nanobdellota archaeon]